MKIGIIVFSQTGNTFSVAAKLEEAIRAKGHDVSIQRVEGLNDSPNAPLKTAPEVTPYDALIFASPVQAFSLAPVMKRYLSALPNLSGKNVYGFVTQHFKKAWLGGNHALRQLSTVCRSKGAEVKKSGVINWSNPAREAQVNDLVKELSELE